MNSFKLIQIKESEVQLRIEGYFEKLNTPFSAVILKKWGTIQTSANENGSRIIGELTKEIGAPSIPPNMTGGESCEGEVMEDNSGNSVLFQGGVLTAVWDFEADKRNCFIDNIKNFLGINK